MSQTFGTYPTNEKPVASQLSRIEQRLSGSARQATLSDILDRIAILEGGQDKLMQSHAALQEGVLSANAFNYSQITERLEAIELKLALLVRGEKPDNLQQLLDLQQQANKASKGHGKARPDRAVRQARGVGVGGRRAGKSR